jgi:hypothetical protein
MMDVGVTGTRNGMTEAQASAFARLMLDLYYRAADSGETVQHFRHGSCKGVDVEAARSVHKQIPGVLVVAHPGPPTDSCQELSGVDWQRLQGKTHFARNRDICRAVEVLIVVPMIRPMPPMGGTTYTFTFGSKLRDRGPKHSPLRAVYVVWPDGSVDENPDVAVAVAQSTPGCKKG